MKESLKIEERAGKVLFRESVGTKCDFPTLSRETGIPVTTLRRYRRNPDMITFDRLCVIAKAMNLSNEEAGYLITGVKTK